jgi:hypothetical protein
MGCMMCVHHPDIRMNTADAVSPVESKAAAAVPLQQSCSVAGQACCVVAFLPPAAA